MIQPGHKILNRDEHVAKLHSFRPSKGRQQQYQQSRNSGSPSDRIALSSQPQQQNYQFRSPVKSKEKFHPSKIMMYKESQGIYQTYIDKQEYEKNLQNKTNSKDQSSSLLQESEQKDKVEELQQNKNKKKLQQQQQQQQNDSQEKIEYLNLSDHDRLEQWEVEKQENNKKEQIKKQKAIQLKNIQGIHVEDKINEIYSILKSSKLQFQKEQNLIDLDEKGIYSIENDEKDRLQQKQINQYITRKPFVRAVPVGKLFNKEDPLITGEIELKIKDKARSSSPPKKKDRFYQTSPQPWRPGKAAPKLFKNESLLIKSEIDVKQKQKQIDRKAATFKISDDPFLRSIDKSNNFLDIEENDYDVVDMRYKTITYHNGNSGNGSPGSRREKQFMKTDNGFFPCKTSPNFQTETNASVKRNMGIQERRQEQLFKQYEQAMKEPLILGMKSKNYFTEQGFWKGVNDQQQQKEKQQGGKAMSPQKMMEGGWRPVKQLPHLFEDIQEVQKKKNEQLQQQKEQANKVRKIQTAHNYIRKQVENSPKLAKNREPQNLGQNKQFFYQPHYKDLHNQNIQSKFEQQMFHSFE